MDRQMTLQELIEIMELEETSREPFTEREKEQARAYKKRKQDEQDNTC
jgi:hypothetical protein